MSFLEFAKMKVISSNISDEWASLTISTIHGVPIHQFPVLCFIMTLRAIRTMSFDENN